MSVAVRTRAPTGYGWSAEGKTPAEISEDIRHTRYRLEADLRALRAQLAPRRLAALAVGTAVLAGLSFLVRKIRGR